MSVSSTSLLHAESSSDSVSPTPLQKALKPIEEILNKALHESFSGQRKEIEELEIECKELSESTAELLTQKKALEAASKHSDQVPVNLKALADLLMKTEDKRAALLIDLHQKRDRMRAHEQEGKEYLKKAVDALGGALASKVRRSACENSWQGARLNFYTHLQLWLLTFTFNQSSDNELVEGFSKQWVSGEKILKEQSNFYRDPTQGADTPLARALLLLLHQGRVLAGVEAVSHQLAHCLDPQLRRLENADEAKKLAEMVGLIIISKLRGHPFDDSTLGKTMLSIFYKQTPLRKADDDDTDLSWGDNDEVEWLSDHFFQLVSELTVQADVGVVWPIGEALTLGGVKVGNQFFQGIDGGERIYGYYNGDMDMVGARRLKK